MAKEQMKARCPGHDDHAPSLIVAIDYDKNLMFLCLAGCSFDDIVRGLKKQGKARAKAHAKALLSEASYKRFLERQAKSAALMASGREFLSGAATIGARYYQGKA